jgi:hypothetical protein
MKNSILEMIDQGLDDFENDRNNDKNIKMLLSFKGTSVEYNEQKFNIEEPKFKKKLNTSVYIKGKNNKLF